MPDSPTDLSKLRILICNDDGIDAEGIKLLERFLRKITPNIWVCAPATNQSAKSHSITFGKHTSVVVDDRGNNHFAVHGSPADSVLIGIQHYMKDCPPDFVFSGVNNGMNLAEDVNYSGTVAVAREAASRGIRSIALSQKMLDGITSWAAAEEALPVLLPYLLKLGMPPSVYFNVNFPVRLRPDFDFAIVRQGRYDVNQAVRQIDDPNGRHVFNIGAARQDHADALDTDLAAMAEGNVAITPMIIDMTDYRMLDKLPRFKPGSMFRCQVA